MIGLLAALVVAGCGAGAKDDAAGGEAAAQSGGTVRSGGGGRGGAQRGGGSGRGTEEFTYFGADDELVVSIPMGNVEGEPPSVVIEASRNEIALVDFGLSGAAGSGLVRASKAYAVAITPASAAAGGYQLVLPLLQQPLALASAPASDAFYYVAVSYVDAKRGTRLAVVEGTFDGRRVVTRFTAPGLFQVFRSDHPVDLKQLEKSAAQPKAKGEAPKPAPKAAPKADKQPVAEAIKELLQAPRPVTVEEVVKEETPAADGHAEAPAAEAPAAEAPAAEAPAAAAPAEAPAAEAPAAEAPAAEAPAAEAPAAEAPAAEAPAAAAPAAEAPAADASQDEDADAHAEAPAAGAPQDAQEADAYAEAPAADAHADHDEPAPIAEATTADTADTVAWQAQRTLASGTDFRLTATVDHAALTHTSTVWKGDAQAFELPKSIKATNTSPAAADETTEAVLRFDAGSCFYLNSPAKARVFYLLYCTNGAEDGDKITTTTLELGFATLPESHDLTLALGTLDLLPFAALVEYENHKDETFAADQERLRLNRQKIDDENDAYAALLAGIDHLLASANAAEVRELEALRLKTQQELGAYDLQIAATDDALAVAAPSQIAKLQQRRDKQVAARAARELKLAASLAAIQAKYVKKRADLATRAAKLTQRHVQRVASYNAAIDKILARIADKQAKIAGYEQQMAAEKAAATARIEQLRLDEAASVDKATKDWEASRDATLASQAALQKQLDDLLATPGTTAAKTRNVQSLTTKLEKGRQRLETLRASYEAQLARIASSYATKVDAEEAKLRARLKSLDEAISKLKA